MWMAKRKKARHALWIIMSLDPLFSFFFCVWFVDSSHFELGAGLGDGENMERVLFLCPWLENEEKRDSEKWATRYASGWAGKHRTPVSLRGFLVSITWHWGLLSALTWWCSWHMVSTMKEGHVSSWMEEERMEEADVWLQEKWAFIETWAWIGKRYSKTARDGGLEEATAVAQKARWGQQTPAEWWASTLGGRLLSFITWTQLNGLGGSMVSEIYNWTSLAYGQLHFKQPALNGWARAKSAPCGLSRPCFQSKKQSSQGLLSFVYTLLLRR